MDRDSFMASLLFLFGSMVLFATYRIIMRWLDRKRVSASPSLQTLEERLTRIEQIVESTAIEVERVAEGQRFTTKVLVERSGELLQPRSTGRVITPH